MNYLDQIFLKFSKAIAIDLGTANIRVTVQGDKNVISEPSIISINTQTGKILSVGFEAKKMVGRTPSNIVAIQPLKNGVISDFNATESLIHYFINKSKIRLSLISRIIHPDIIVAVPTLITEVEIRAVIDAVKSAGGRKVYIVEEPIAAAIGSNLRIDESQGAMIVDIGGGTTDIAILSLGGIITDNSIRSAGDEMDKAIVEYIQNKYNLLIGLKVAEGLKKEIASALPGNTIKTAQVKGQDLISSLPKGTEISNFEISEAISPVIEKILTAIIEAIEKTPTEIIGDLINNGIVISGGGALIHNLDKYLSQKLKVRVRVSPDPVFAVIRGLEKLMTDIKLLDKVQIKDFILK